MERFTLIRLNKNGVEQIILSDHELSKIYKGVVIPTSKSVFCNNDESHNAIMQYLENEGITLWKLKDSI